MASKQELLTLIFWLRTTLIHLSVLEKRLPTRRLLEDIALQLFFLQSEVTFSTNKYQLIERVTKEVRHLQNHLTDMEIDWEKEVKEMMEKNCYQKYGQLKPDYGF